MGFQQACRHRKGHCHTMVGEEADDGDHAHANLAAKASGCKSFMRDPLEGW